MWQRNTYHDCANELASISERFRMAYTGQLQTSSNDAIMQECSIKGVEILKVLALSIRSEQDYGLLENPTTIIGAVKDPIEGDRVFFEKRFYEGEFRKKINENSYKPLYLRTGLNKIAHSDPRKSSFYASQDCHDLILVGTRGNNSWIAFFSLLKLIDVIRLLPDMELNEC